jgi:hypothetical protein
MGRRMVEGPGWRDAPEFEFELGDWLFRLSAANCAPVKRELIEVSPRVTVVLRRWTSVANRRGRDHVLSALPCANACPSD